MLQAVLDYHQPREWQAANYTEQTYQLFDVDSGSDEYTIVTTPFTQTEPALVIKSLSRVQNPYQLGRFIVRSEQHRHRSEDTARVTYYHPIDGSDLNKALEFNMDPRRYLSRCDRQHSQNKNPVFFSTPAEAFSVVSECKEKVLLVCHVLERNGYGSNMTVKNVDTEYMPNYIAFVESSK